MLRWLRQFKLTDERLLAVIFLLTLPLVNPYVRGDGNGYYAYVRSLVIDGDLHFENEFRRGDPSFVMGVFEEGGGFKPTFLLPNGSVRNQWSVGPAMLWSPFFLAAHSLVWIADKLGANIPADGYSLPYRWVCALGTALYGFIGLLLAYRVAKRFVTGSIALMAVIGIWFASSVPVYLYFLPFHVHVLAAFSVSLFVWYWQRTEAERSIKQWGLWGLIGGLMVEVYYINAVFLLIALLAWMRGGIAESREQRAKGLKHRLVNGIVFGLAVLLALVPHFVIKWIIHGSALNTGYGDTFFWSSPRLWQVGFASEHGMFLWTPVLLLAVAGLMVFWRRDRWVAVNLLLTFAVFYYAVACYQNWHGQSAFGIRFFVSFTPAFILGLAMVLEKSQALLARAVQMPPALRLLPSGVLAGLILWNIGFIFQWGTNLVPNRGPVDFAVMARNQVTVVPQRIVGFLVRYVKAREQVTREVERQDIEESKGYHVQR
jgi:hypothetical protein